MQASTSYVAQPQLRPPRPCALDRRRLDLRVPCPAPNRILQGRAAVFSRGTTRGWARAGDQDDWAFLDEEPDLEAELDELEDSEGGRPGYWLQNALALALLAVLGLSGLNVLAKLAFVVYAIASTGLRYCVVGLFLVLLISQWD